MKLHDVVRVTRDIPDKGLTRGMVGVIVLIFDTPNLAYEVEIANEHGETIAQAALEPGDIEPFEA